MKKKNTIKVFGIIAIVAVIGFTMAGCKEDEPPSNENTDGRLTITGLSAYNGKYAQGSGGTDTKNLGAADKLDYSALIPGLITNGSVTLKVWEWKQKDIYQYWANYKGNDTCSFSIGIFETTDANSGINHEPIMITVTFANGIGSGHLCQFRN
ncbi:MAG: hypothetical protein LBH43_04470 [Treponema sp.]|jgi:hypothetical protein|nr:hypothetical protein [Treponema sp.]